MEEWGKRLRSQTCLADRHERINATDFETYYDVRTNFIDASKADLGELIKTSYGGTALGTFNTSQALNLTSSITYNSPHSKSKTFGKPIVAIYQGAGTAASDQIYPIVGANVTLGRYDVVGGEVDRANYNGTSDQWRAMIIDSNGTSTQAITFYVDWIFVDYRSNEAV